MSQFFASSDQSTGASASASSEYSGLISSEIGWLDLLCYLQDSQESSLAPQFESINSFVKLSHKTQPFCDPTLTSVHDYWEKP